MKIWMSQRLVVAKTDDYWCTVTESSQKSRQQAIEECIHFIASPIDVTDPFQPKDQSNVLRKCKSWHWVMRLRVLKPSSHPKPHPKILHHNYILDLRISTTLTSSGSHVDGIGSSTNKTLIPYNFCIRNFNIRLTLVRWNSIWWLTRHTRSLSI